MQDADEAVGTNIFVFSGSAAALCVGQRVEGNFDGEGEWYAGCVAAVNGGAAPGSAATYDIVYDDGDEETAVRRGLIRLEGEGGEGEAAGDEDGDPEELFAQQCLAAGLPTPAEAAATEVARIPGFLDLDEIAEIKAALAEAQAEHDVAFIERGVDGSQEDDGVWRTSYLHTRGFFRERLPHFKDKFRRAMERVDEAHWGVLRGRAPAAVNWRNVEVPAHAFYFCNLA